MRKRHAWCPRESEPTSSGGRLAEAALDAARSAGYAHIRLDTLSSMEKALRVYQRLGFHDIDAYRHNPLEAARYLELEL